MDNETSNKIEDATASTVAEVAAATELPSDKKKSTKKPMLVIALLILLVAGAATSALLGKLDSPEKIMADAVTNTFATTSGSFDIDAKITTPDSGGINPTISIGGSGAENGDVELSFDINLLLTKLGFEVKTVDGDAYLRVTGLSGLLGLLQLSGLGGVDSEIALPSGDSPIGTSQIVELIDILDNQWVVIDASFIEEVLGADASQNISEEDTQQIIDVFANNFFFVFSEELEDSDTAHHYSITLDKEKIVSFFQEFIELDAYKDQMGALDADESTIDELRTELEDLDVSGLKAEAWITKDTRLIERVDLSTSVDGAALSLTMTFDELNSTIVIEAPSDALDIAELTESINRVIDIEALAESFAPLLPAGPSTDLLPEGIR